MTTLIGVVVDGVGYLAADRRCTLGNATAASVKLVPHPASDRVVFSAAGLAMLVYPATLIDPPDGAPGPAWCDSYWKSALELGRPPLVDGPNGPETDGNLLVLTPGAVTLVGAASGWPTEIGADGIALGSGGDFALGAFHAYRDTCPDEPVEDVLKRAVTVACRLNPSGSGDGIDVLAM